MRTPQPGFVRKRLRILILAAIYLAIAWLLWLAVPPGPRIQFPEGLSIVCLSPDGKWLLLQKLEELQIWDAQAGSLHASLSLSKDKHRRSEFSPDGRTLAVADGRELLLICNVVTAETDRISAFMGDRFYSPFAFSGDGKTLAHQDLHGEEPCIRLLDVETKKVRQTLRGASLPPVFSPDGKMLATVWKDSEIRLWNVYDGREMATLRGHSWPVKCLCFSPDGNRLASIASNTHVNPRVVATSKVPYEIKLWDLAKGGRHTSCVSNIYPPTSIRFNVDGSALIGPIISHLKTSAHAWDVRSAEDGLVLLDANEVFPNILSPDGKRAVPAVEGRPTQSQQLSIKDIPSMEEMAALSFNFNSPVESISPLTFTPDSKTLVVQVKWNSTKPGWVRKLRSYVPGRVLPSTPSSPSLIFFDIRTGAKTVELNEGWHPWPIVFTQEGRFLIGGTAPKLWDNPPGVSWKIVVSLWVGQTLVFYGVWRMVRRWRKKFSVTAS